MKYLALCLLLFSACTVAVEDRRVNADELKVAFEHRDEALKMMAQLLEKYEERISALEKK